MTKSRDPNFADIDSTLDFLIKNANILRSIAEKALADREMQHLKDIQDHLLTRLISKNEPEPTATRIRTSKTPRIGRNRRTQLKIN